MSRIPRKKKKRIPKGTYYCYSPDAEKNRKCKDSLYNEGGSYYIKPCPYYRHIDGLWGKCRVFKCSVTDQVKECGYGY